MKKIFFISLFVAAVLSQNSRADERQAAQCMLHDQDLTVLATVHTVRGNEFFEWKIKGIQPQNVLGDHDGAEVKNLLEQLSLPKPFQVTIENGSSEGEVAVDIKNCDLSFLTPVRDFSFRCNILAY